MRRIPIIDGEGIDCNFVQAGPVTVHLPYPPEGGFRIRVEKDGATVNGGIFLSEGEYDYDGEEFAKR